MDFLFQMFCIIVILLYKGTAMEQQWNRLLNVKYNIESLKKRSNPKIC